MSFKQTYRKAASKLVVRETRLRSYEETSLLALVTSMGFLKTSGKCFYCRKSGPIVRECHKKEAKREKQDNKGGRKCFKCAKVGDITRNCHKRKNRDENSGDHEDISMVIVTPRALLMSTNCRKSDRRMLDLCCLKHMSNKRSFFSNFVQCKEALQVVNSEVIPSHGVGVVRRTTMVDGSQHRVTLSYALYTPNVLHNLIYIFRIRKNKFGVRDDENPSNVICDRMDLVDKPSDEVKMCGLETQERL